MEEKIDQPTCINKWKAEHPNSTINWEHVFRNTNEIKDSHLRWFEMRILHRILPTQKLLYAMKIMDSPYCTFCQDEAETIKHLICSCQYVKSFWVELEDEINTVCPQSTIRPLTDAVTFK